MRLTLLMSVPIATCLQSEKGLAHELNENYSIITLSAYQKQTDILALMTASSGLGFGIYLICCVRLPTLDSQVKQCCSLTANAIQTVTKLRVSLRFTQQRHALARATHGSLTGS